MGAVIGWCVVWSSWLCSEVDICCWWYSCFLVMVFSNNIESRFVDRDGDVGWGKRVAWVELCTVAHVNVQLWGSKPAGVHEEVSLQWFLCVAM